MMLPSDNYDLFLLADYLEEYGSSFDIVKANAIRNNKYDLNYEDNCKSDVEGWGYGRGFGCGIYYGINYSTLDILNWGDGCENGNYGIGDKVNT